MKRTSLHTIIYVGKIVALEWTDALIPTVKRGDN
jgi:hypothetical protein